MWIIMAIFSAVFAGITSILAKCGIRKTDSDVATAVRTIIVLVFSWLMVLFVGSANSIGQIELKSWIFIILSGMATGASWICYFYALSKGDINKVVPIDKSSTILSIILAIICFGETEKLVLKLILTVVLGVGIYLMVEKKNSGSNVSNDKKWFVFAILSAVFAALTSILAKVGISGVESNLCTAIRTVVVLIMAWIIVGIKGKLKLVKGIDRKELSFICLSGLATGGSWLCYYYAIKNGVVSVVVPIDKMSILVTVAFSYFVFKEKLSKKAFLGLVLMFVATLSMAIFI